MPAQLNGRFYGSLEDLTAFLTSTFKDPNALVLSVEFKTAGSTQAAKAGSFSMDALWAAAATARSECSGQRFRDVLPETVKHIRTNKITAIKLVRDATGLGLKEAKDIVELVLLPRIEQQRAEDDGDPFSVT